MKTYIYPDCGQKIDNNQNDCPNCGCPATMLKEVVQQETATFDSNESILPTMKKISVIKLILSILFFAGLTACQTNSSESSNDSDNTYSSEQKRLEQERKKEEQAKQEYEQARQEMLDNVVGTWVSEHIPSSNTNTGYYYFTLHLNRSMNFEIFMYEVFSNLLLDKSSGKYEVIPASKSDNNLGNIIINPKIDNAIATVYSNTRLEFRGYTFTRSY